MMPQCQYNGMPVSVRFHDIELISTWLIYSFVIQTLHYNDNADE